MSLISFSTKSLSGSPVQAPGLFTSTCSPFSKTMLSSCPLIKASQRSSEDAIVRRNGARFDDTSRKSISGSLFSGPTLSLSSRQCNSPDEHLHQRLPRMFRPPISSPLVRIKKVDISERQTHQPIEDTFNFTLPCTQG